MLKKKNFLDKTGNIFVKKEDSLKSVLIKINENQQKSVILVDNRKRFKDVISDGDIRRSLLKGLSLDDKVKSIKKKKKPFFLNDEELKKKPPLKEIISKNKKKKFGVIPVINKKQIVVDYLNSDKENKLRENKYQVVIMAGGKGIRMKPFTDFFPKPLLPYGEKTILDHIIDNFIENDFKNFILSINFKSKFLKAYIEDKKKSKKFKVTYIEEKKPLGSAGSLYLLKKKMSDDFILINCDTLLNVDYKQIFDFHQSQKNDLTLIVSLKNSVIPYGVCKLSKNNKLIKILEKPKNNYLANTGCYIVNPSCLKLIQNNKFLDFNFLIEKIIKKKMKIGLFPIDDFLWQDAGSWDKIKEKK